VVGFLYKSQKEKYNVFQTYFIKIFRIRQANKKYFIYWVFVFIIIIIIIIIININY
jgi:hypothetical protein